MQIKDPKKILLEYLAKAKLMQVSTSKDNQPWTVTVWFANDEKLNLYFISYYNRKHSLEIKDNPKVSGAIVQPFSEGPGQKVRGVAFQGLAEEVKDTEVKEVYDKYYKKKWPMSHTTSEDIIKRLVPTRVYRIKPKLFVLFDTVNFPDQPRQEIKI